MSRINNTLRAIRPHLTQPSPALVRHASTAPRIAIVGGGPGGLTLGRLLHKKQIPFTIFEFRPKPTAAELAKPSGMLDLHEESGLAAIRECGVYDEFVPLTGECSEEFTVADKTGVPVFTHSGQGERPEISRNNLYKLLLAHLPEESVRWEHKLTASTTENGVTELDFGEGRKEEFDFVVGADGAWSRVRHLVTDARPNYTGVQTATITIRDITKKFPHLAELVGSGSFSALGDKQAVISQRGPQDSSRIYLMLSTKDEQFGANSGVANQPASEAKGEFLDKSKFLGAFGPKVKELVATACDQETLDNPGSNLDIRPLYSLPHGSSWEHKKGVTLVGDAAHVMLPNGEGVNQAMLDTLLLAEVIGKAYGEEADRQKFGEELDGLVREFEEKMVERAVKVGKDTDELFGAMLGSDDAAQEMLKFFGRAHERGDI